MCILFATREHPDYELIMISNRDEFLERKTHSTCWHNGDYILSPYDMARSHELGNETIFGTWSGVNRDGRVATVLNLRLSDELDVKRLIGERSRGILPYIYLLDRKHDFNDWETYEKFHAKYPYLDKTGDFNLFYGDFKKGEYRVIDSLGHTYNLFDSETKKYMVISNDIHERNGSPGVDYAGVEDAQEWGKIKKGKDIFQAFVKESQKFSKEDVIQGCFKLASTDLVDVNDSVGFDLVKGLGVTKETVYVPPLLTPPHEELGSPLTAGSYYGTRSQIVLLVSKDKKKVTFIERILYSSDNEVNIFSSNKPKEELRYEFDI
ncbi:Uncharacterized protein RNJ44_01328 [Nakaseomyces bracarensis]|uniref:DUF833-domain-containing protein n=1 Tax=Nakaseomyces bracarensis TaxID=273131 RepID=A0ABR4NPE1_9SACH